MHLPRYTFSRSSLQTRSLQQKQATAYKSMISVMIGTMILCATQIACRRSHPSNRSIRRRFCNSDLTLCLHLVSHLTTPRCRLLGVGGSILPIPSVSKTGRHEGVSVCSSHHNATRHRITLSLVVRDRAHSAYCQRPDFFAVTHL